MTNINLQLELKNIPDIIPSDLSLHIKVLGTETVYPLKITTSSQRESLQINKLRVYYFFVENVDEFRNWIRRVEVSEINNSEHVNIS